MVHRRDLLSPTLTRHEITMYWLDHEAEPLEVQGSLRASTLQLHQMTCHIQFSVLGNCRHAMQIPLQMHHHCFRS